MKETWKSTEKKYDKTKETDKRLKDETIGKIKKNMSINKIRQRDELKVSREL